MLQQEILRLRQVRAKAIADGRAIHERAAKEKRALNADEAKQWDQFIGEAAQLKDQVVRLERQWELEKDIESIDARDLDANPNANTRENAQADTEKRQLAAFGKFLSRGLGVLDETERRDLQVGTGPDGGFLLAPTQWVNQLIRFVNNQVIIRQKATKMTLTASESLGQPTLDSDPADADWTSEIATGSADTSMKVGKREFKPSPLAKRIKVSNKLIQRGGSPIEALIMERLGYKFAVSQEQAFMTGNGVGKPLGLFVANSSGISTARDVTCGSTTAPTGDGLIAMKFALKPQYWGKAEWIFHRDVMSTVAQLKDNYGQYIFRESLRAGEPDVLLGRPINMSEYAPNTLTTGQYVALLGDYSFYHIVDALSFQVQRLVELYAESNQTGFIGRAELDGMPVLEEAFVRGALA